MDCALTLHDLWDSANDKPVGIPRFSDMAAAMQDLRERLAPDVSLADAYIDALHSFVADVRSHTMGEEGESAALQLLAICRSVIRKDRKMADHPFYSQAVQHVATAPMPTEISDSNKARWLFWQLADEYYPLAVEEFQNKVSDRCYDNVSENEYSALYQKVAVKLLGIGCLATLHEVYLQTYWVPSPLAVFRLGYVQALADSVCDSICQSGD